jgi:hypothetical protein
MQKALAFAWCILHHAGMKRHAEIVAAAGADKLSALTGVSVHTCRSWGQRDSIPGEYWKTIAGEGLASLDELAAAAAARRAGNQPVKIADEAEAA